MAGFTFRLELEDGTPADAPTFRTAVPNWQAGDTIPLGAGSALALRVIAIRDNDRELALAHVVRSSRATPKRVTDRSRVRNHPQDRQPRSERLPRTQRPLEPDLSRRKYLTAANMEEGQ
jgi:hypothetical protein